MDNSLRISLITAKCWDDYRIERDKPAVMNEFTSYVDWMKFCNDIDKALQGLDNWSKAFKILAVTFFLSIFALPVIYYMYRHTFPVYGFLAPCAVFVFMALCAFVVTKTQLSARDKIQEILDIVSVTQPRLSFDLKFENARLLGGNEATPNKYYIEVTIQSGQSYMTTAQGMVDDNEYVVNPFPNYDEEVPSSTAVATQLSPATRLEELEKIKHLLTEEEYGGKRVEILNDM